MTKQILVIDDEESMTDLVQAVLTRSGYDVMIAADGKAGLQIVTDTPPDLVICDIMMPVMDGIEVVRRLKADPATASIPIILLTARSSQDNPQDAVEYASLYLTKPFNPFQLLSRVHELIPPEAEG